MTLSSRVRLAAAAVLAVAVVVSLAVLPVKTWLDDFSLWAKGQGTLGLVLLGAAYTPASLLLFPASILTLSAGAVYGVGWGVVAVSLGSTFAAGVVFLVGRYLARGWVERKLADSPRFAALDRAVGERGFYIVLLTRLSPVFPFTLLNYAFSLTRVSFRDYILASWIGMLPGTLMYVYLGSAARGLFTVIADLAAGRAPEDPLQTSFFFLGLAVTVGVTVYVTRLARQALRTAVPEATS